MDPETHKILISSDEKDRWEFPENFNRMEQMKLIGEFKDAFEFVLKSGLNIDEHVEDASFTTELEIVEEGSVNNKFLFRFSNFGNLYTVINMPDTANHFYTGIIDCKQILKDSGFIFVDISDLDEVYDGINKPYAEGLTWWTRYFDYL